VDLSRNLSPHELVSLLVVLLLSVVLLLALLPVLAVPGRDPAWGFSNCKNNQKQLMLAAIMYRDGQGKNTTFPPYDGSAFLTALYTTGVNTEADQYLCPASGDDNRAVVWSTVGNTGAMTSYAARKNSNPRAYPGIYTAKGAAETVVISDDSEGEIRFNHGTGCIVAFADGHVELVDVDKLTIVGHGFLDPLAN